jgi:hypothetical protein
MLECCGTITPHRKHLAFPSDHFHAAMVCSVILPLMVMWHAVYRSFFVMELSMSKSNVLDRRSHLSKLTDSER